MRARVNSQRGFTLIELMIVIILIGIFTGLMVGEMRGTFEDALLRSTARKLIATANLASSKAVTSTRAHSMHIDSTAGTIRIQMEGDSATPEDEKLDTRVSIEVRESTPVVDADEEEGSKDEQQSVVNPERIRFFPDGTATGREITLRDRLGVELRLQINPITSRIRMLESEVAR